MSTGLSTGSLINILNPRVCVISSGLLASVGLTICSLATGPLTLLLGLIFTGKNKNVKLFWFLLFGITFFFFRLNSYFLLKWIVFPTSGTKLYHYYFVYVFILLFTLIQYQQWIYMYSIPLLYYIPWNNIKSWQAYFVQFWANAVCNWPQFNILSNSLGMSVNYFKSVIKQRFSFFFLLLLYFIALIIIIFFGCFSNYFLLNIFIFLQSDTLGRPVVCIEEHPRTILNWTILFAFSSTF